MPWVCSRGPVDLKVDIYSVLLVFAFVISVTRVPLLQFSTINTKASYQYCKVKGPTAWSNSFTKNMYIVCLNLLIFALFTLQN